ncbi:AbrB/MazE/SpoVT family DNA-binding domain-containing protein [Candidatus Woesearchaeota archaeon]|nr:AbrB/MazE/SpoVT family DNA-binding domain-containing protein [Candidatus Woesearchaeota archaeon]
MKVVAYKGQYRVTIPKDLAEAKGWKPKTKLRFVEDTGGNVILKEIKEKNDRANKKNN